MISPQAASRFDPDVAYYQAMKTACRNFSLFFVLSTLVACSTDAPPFEPDAETGQKAPAPLPFSAAVEAGDNRYFSGWGSRNPETGEHPEGFEAQSEQLMKNLVRLLDRQGLTFSEVVHANLYIVDSTQLETFYEVYQKCFPDNLPALTAVAIPELPDTRVELTFIASAGQELQEVVPETLNSGAAFMNPGVLSGDYLYISSCGGRIYSENYVPEGDFSAQIRGCMDGLEQVLQAADMGFADVVKSEIFLTDLNRSEELRTVYETYFGAALPAATLSQVEALPGGADVSVSFIASRGGEVIEMQKSFPGFNASPAVRTGERLYLSGLTGSVNADIEAQVKQVMDELGDVLAAAGMSFSDVADAKVYLADMDDYAAMNRVYGSYFDDGFPTRSCIEMDALPKDAGVQITLVADSRRLLNQ